MKTILRILTAAAVLSCGSGDQKTAGESIPLTEMPIQLRKALCERIFSCCSPTELKNNPDLGSSVDSCQAALNGEATILLGDIEASVTAGRVIYHGDRMATCMAELKTRSCEQLKMPANDMDITQMCKGVFEPQVAVGGACTEYWDCAGGWCQGDLGGLRDHCFPLKPEGSECDEGPECSTGVCSDERFCEKRPAGSGNICAFGTEGVGEHGAGPPGQTPAGPMTDD